MTEALLNLHREPVQDEWIDYNGHMNLAYYVLIFDHATDALLDHLALDEAYRAETGCSVFVAEAHVTYEREVMAGEAVRVATRVIDCDDKRLHVFHEMYTEPGDELTATNELMILHVDLDARRTTPFPAKPRSTMAALKDRNAGLPKPGQVGRIIGIPAKKP